MWSATTKSRDDVLRGQVASDVPVQLAAHLERMVGQEYLEQYTLSIIHHDI